MSSSLPQHLGQCSPRKPQRNARRRPLFGYSVCRTAALPAMLCGAGLSAVMLPRLPPESSSRSAQERSGQKAERKRGEGLPSLWASARAPPAAAAQAPVRFYALSTRYRASLAVQTQLHVACPPGSCRALVMSLLFLYPGPRGGGFVQTRISWLPHLSTFVLSAFYGLRTQSHV